MFSLQDGGFCCVFQKCGEKLKLAEHALLFTNKTAGRNCLKPGSGRQISVIRRTFGLSLNREGNVLGLKSYIKLPIGNKTNIVSIMLTKGWL